MKLVETFLLSEAFEKEVMLIKFILSNHYIDEWIICENLYSFQGAYKGIVAASILDNDDRFIPYRDRITIITAEKKFTSIAKDVFQDAIAFESESWQRQLSFDYFMGKYQDIDWLIIHDVDEMLDLTSDERRSEFFERMKNADQGCLSIPRLRYWFDFDNKYNILYGSPMCTRKFLLNKTNKSIAQIRREISRASLHEWKNIIAFEYSSCYPVDGLLSKIKTYAHTGITEEDLQRSLSCNHRTLRKNVMKDYLRPNDKNYFEVVTLNKDNSPLYIRQHLAELKTNNIPPDYIENRKREYPQFYNWISLSKIKISDGLKNGKALCRMKFKFFKIRLRLLVK